MQSDCVPYQLGLVLGEVVLQHETAGSVCALDFEALWTLRVLGQAEVMQHRAEAGDLFVVGDAVLGCIACHQGVNVGGNLFQRHGIFHPLGSPEPELVRVPSLRNVATTPPYFHDGSAATLAGAVRAMGFAQLDRVLSGEQSASIVRFLYTLNGTYKGSPVTPRGQAQRIVMPP